MKYKLHTAKKADWEKTTRDSYNRWQKTAAGSHGILTPGNLISLAGGFLALYGLWVILNDDVVTGLVLLTLGRFADLADGIVAEQTKTKSPLGETVDASIDKIVVAATLIILGALELVPWIIIIIVALQNLANVLISIVAKLRDRTIHPSRIGKVSAAFSWVTIILYPLGDWLKQDNSPTAGNLLIAIAIACFFIYIVMGLRATLSYAHAIYRKPTKKLYRLFR